MPAYHKSYDVARNADSLSETHEWSIMTPTPYMLFHATSPQYKDVILYHRVKDCTELEAYRAGLVPTVYFNPETTERFWARRKTVRDLGFTLTALESYLMSFCNFLEDYLVDPTQPEGDKNVVVLSQRETWTFASKPTSELDDLIIPGDATEMPLLLPALEGEGDKPIFTNAMRLISAYLEKCNVPDMCRESFTFSCLTSVSAKSPEEYWEK